jgi:Uma2 family endonuclease
MATIVTETSAHPQTEFTPPNRCLYRLSLEKYEAMVETGLFTKRDRFQLLEGLLVTKMTENPPHSSVSVSTAEAIQAILPAGWHLRGEKPLRIPSRASLPEPDIVITRGRSKDYLKRHPDPADVALVIEVADSSLDDDRALMLRVYGGGGVIRYWIVNLVDGQVEVYSQPSGPSEPIGYRHCEVYQPGQEVPVLLDEVEIGRIAVSDIIP